jgi:hypothetical protein
MPSNGDEAFEKDDDLEFGFVGKEWVSLLSAMKVSV